MNQKVYSGVLSGPEKSEIFDFLQRGVLIQGDTVHAGFVKLIYSDTKKEAATQCQKCNGYCGESKISRTAL